MRALQRNLKLKDAIAQFLELGLANTPDVEPPTRVPRPVRLRKSRRLTISDIEAAIAAGRK